MSQDTSTQEWPATVQEWRDLAFAKGASSERLDTIARTQLLSAAGHTVNGLVCLVYLYDKVEPLSLFLVCAPIFLVAMLLSYTHYKHKTPRKPLLSQTALKRICISAFITALPWAIFSVYSVITVPVTAKMLPYGVIAGMAAGGTMVLSAIPAAAVIFTSTIVVPLMITSLIWSNGNEYLFGICLTFYIVMLSMFSVRGASNITNSEKNERLLRQHMEELTIAHEKNSLLASTDSLTGLPNRRAFYARLEHAVAELASRDEALVMPVFLMDLDNFKTINDTMGHDIGDLYLCDIAERIKASVPEDWTVARIGGDEFAMIAPHGLNVDALKTHGQALVEAVNLVVAVNGRPINSGGSIGACYAPHHGRSVNELMAYADDALSQAKAAGRGQFMMFDLADKERHRQKLNDGRLLKSDQLESAILMAYQPQFDLSTKTFFGFEALVRWNHPEKGIQPPLYLLQIAEERGLILELCGAIFKKVADDMRRWRAKGMNFGRVAVNVHQAHLLNPEHLFMSAVNLGAAAGGNRFITLEVTENAIIGRGTDEVRGVLEHLSAMGFRIALDDFGTGYSSLTHLTDLPISELKIDRQFVHGITSKLTNYAVVKSVYDMARLLGIDIVAEGIETEDQAQTIAALGKMIAQGYLFGRPMFLDEAEQLMRQQQGMSLIKFIPHFQRATGGH